MKKNSHFHSTQNRSYLLLIAIFMLAVSACSRKMQFMQSTVVPAAEGTVKIKKDKNNNYKIDVNTIRLAGPERLQPSKSTYVVWVKTKDNGNKNIGQLKSSSGFLSKTLKASLSTTTPFTPEQFFITAEDGGTVQYPGHMVVLSTGY